VDNNWNKGQGQKWTARDIGKSLVVLSSKALDRSHHKEAETAAPESKFRDIHFSKGARNE
jgi:hypothetical protein